MANTTLQVRKSGATGNVPPSLAFGELALNYADGKLYYKASNGSITYIQSGTSTDSFATINANSSLILATSPTDTLSILPGNNITISTDTIGKSITINSSGIDQFARNTANIANTPAGSTTQVQFNDGGIRGASSSLTFDKTTGVLTAPIVASSNNGNGTNFKVGDDIWIGDVNLADTMRLTGQQNSNNAYIVFGAANNSQALGRSGTGALTYTGAFTATGLVSGNELTSTNSIGSEGGQVNLSIPASGTSLTGSVTIDVFGNQLRFFQGNSAKGAYIDLTAAADNVGTNLLSGGGGSAIDQYARDTANLSIGIDATQNTRLSSIETVNNNQNTSISIIQGVDNTQNANITSVNQFAQGAYNTANGANGLASSAYGHANNAFNYANTQVSIIAGIDASQNTRLNSIETINTNQNTSISIIQGVDNTQNTNITAVNNFAQGAYNTANVGYNFVNSGGNISGDVIITANNDLTVTGNLIVLGNTFSVGTQTLEVVDPMIILANGNFFSDTVDIGFAGHYNDGSNAHTGLFRDFNTKDWYLFQGYTPELSGNNNVVISDPSFDTANLIAKKITANVSATTITISGRDQASVDSTQNSQITAVNQFAQAAYNQANSAGGGTTVTISDDNTSNNVYYVNFTANTSGNANTLYVSSNNLSFIPSTGTIGVKAINLTANTNISSNAISLPNDLNQATIDSFSTSIYRGAFYQVQMSGPAGIHILNLNITHDDTSVFANTFGDAYSTAPLGTFSGNIVGTTLNVLFTPTNALTTVAFIRNVIVKMGVETPAGSLGFVGDPVTVIYDAGFNSDPTTISFDYGNVP